MQLNERSLAGDRAAWEAAGVALPAYNRTAMRAATAEAPVWAHLGSGNIFRAFVAVLADDLLASGALASGIVVVDRGQAQADLWRAHDGLTLDVTLCTDGSTPRRMVGSVAEALCTGNEQDWPRIVEVFRSPSLQLASLTITEKGYAVRDGAGELLPAVAASIRAGTPDPGNLMTVLAALLRERWQAGGAPLALVSMDNCAHNGDNLRAAVLTVVDGWAETGHVSPELAAWAHDASQVSFPCTMIDKIVPGPSADVAAALAAAGIEGMKPQVTPRGTELAPFANAEEAQYLVVEDAFPGGRPPLAGRGVYLGTRADVEAAEHMKVACCLNPIHTALATLGCLLSYTYIADEMADPDLAALAHGLGYDEGLPVVGAEGILSPRAFLDEFLGSRVRNPFLHDTPQRIATDTSQKVGVRFGSTLRGHMAAGDAGELRFVPLTIAAWLRYLEGTDDAGAPMACSPDPRLAELQALMAAGEVRAILKDESIFTVDLYEAGVAPRVEEYLRRMGAGTGSVRTTLHDVVSSSQA